MNHVKKIADQKNAKKETAILKILEKKIVISLNKKTSIIKILVFYCLKPHKNILI